MPDDDPDAFRLWVQRLFVATITCSSNIVCVKAWILGDKLGCPDFQNLVMEILLQSHSPSTVAGIVEPSTLRVAYEGSAPGSKLRKWALDFFFFKTRDNKQEGSLALQQNTDWVSQAKSIEDFCQDYMEAHVRCSLEGEPIYPWVHKDQYMADWDSTTH